MQIYDNISLNSSWNGEMFQAKVVEKSKHKYVFSARVPIVSHIDPVHALQSDFMKINVNIILPSTPGSSK